MRGYRRADYEGRSTIKEAWILHLWVVAVAFVLAIGNSVALSVMPTDAVNYGFLGLFGLLLVVSALPYASMFVRRFHDLNLSGRWALLALVPFVGGLVIIPVFLIPGIRQPNRFGPPPGGNSPSAAPAPPTA